MTASSRACTEREPNHGASPVNSIRWPFPRATDRARWAAVRDTLGSDGVDERIRAAESLMSRPIPMLPASAALDYFRTGNRDTYERPWSVRRKMLSSLVIAECLERDGRFIDAIVDVGWAICEESVWELPAHLEHLPAPADDDGLDDTGIDRLPDQHDFLIGLSSSMTASLLAETAYLLDGVVPDRMRTRVAHECETRIIGPYLERSDYWWLASSPIKQVNNWNSVCNANVLITALYLESDEDRLGALVDKAVRSLGEYRATFDRTGGSTEGVGYWTFGFGNYVLAAHMLRERTGGSVNLFEWDLLDDVITFPIRCMLSLGRYVSFADSEERLHLPPALLNFLSTEFDAAVPPATVPSAEHFRGIVQGFLAWELRSLFWVTADGCDDGSGAVPAADDWFDEMTWMISRSDPADPAALVLAAKGGHNDEMHNQNDVGNVIVHYGGESLIADLGRGRYTRDYFSRHRYDRFENQSSGHSVPVVNGLGQGTGREFEALVIERLVSDERSEMRLDLAGAYPAAAGLERLTRTITLHRDRPEPVVEIVDDVEFTSAAGTFESVLITLHDVSVDRSCATIGDGSAALTVRFDSAVVTASVDVRHDVELPAGPTTVRRVCFELVQPTHATRVALEIVPCT